MSSSSLPNLASTNTARPAVDIPATMGDTDDDELMLLYGDYGDDIYLADRKRDSVIEARLTPEERHQFDDAKIKALQPWIENAAWEAADPSDAHAGEVCPMRFLLKWKRKGDGFEANARVILQGFHLHEVTSVNVDKNSPTLSRLGRSLILQVCAMKGWKLLVADVRSCRRTTSASRASASSADPPPICRRSLRASWGSSEASCSGCASPRSATFVHRFSGTSLPTAA